MYIYVNLREEPYDISHVELFREITVLNKQDNIATHIIVGLSGKDIHERAILFNTCEYVYLVVTDASTKTVSDFIAAEDKETDSDYVMDLDCS